MACLCPCAGLHADDGHKPAITFDEFFDSVSIDDARIRADGRAVVIETERASWDQNRYLHDLWMWKDEGAGKAVQITRSGYDHSPRWSPDGEWIAFLSERTADGAPEGKEHETSQVWVMAASGGEAFAVTRGAGSVHAFAWAADSKAIYFATRIPWNKKQEEDYRKQWNDVVRFRESERGDAVFAAALGAAAGKAAEPKEIARSDYRVAEMTASPDGKKVAFATEAPSERVESTEPFGIYLADPAGGGARLLSHTQAIYENLQWSTDGHSILFQVVSGSVEGRYRDVQARLYSVEADGPGRGAIHRWAQGYAGSIAGYSAGQGGVAVLGISGTETQPYETGAWTGALRKLPALAGAYVRVSAASGSPRMAFVYSSLQRPVEVYLAEDATGVAAARPITSFNAVFKERELPRGRVFRWRADDGAAVEGMLIYPPGQFGAKGLRTLTLIHGGPADADQDRWGADWYDWAILAASRGWLVFRPNYRGSVGYGDEFAMQTVPHIVSRPGRDILEGVDALVKDGAADPAKLTVGGYSEGGYLTNWLITQTTRFRAAVTGAGAVEHVLNWGNDDETFDDAFYMGGNPWEAERNYNEEAAIWQIAKVRTPTHMVVGGADVRVHFGESYLLERALRAVGVPCSLLVFPGEGHSLRNNPWHGKIKVREELKWLEKYGSQ